MESSHTSVSPDPQEPPLEVVIDGSRVSDFHGFIAEFSRAYCEVFNGPAWKGDFDDLDEMLEAPGKRFLIRWTNSEKSRPKLGHQAMADFRRQQLSVCQTEFPNVPTLHHGFREKLKAAISRSGPTLFEYLCEELAYDPYCWLRLE